MTCVFFFSCQRDGSERVSIYNEYDTLKKFAVNPRCDVFERCNLYNNLIPVYADIDKIIWLFGRR